MNTPNWVNWPKKRRSTEIISNHELSKKPLRASHQSPDPFLPILLHELQLVQQQQLPPHLPADVQQDNDRIHRNRPLPVTFPSPVDFSLQFGIVYVLFFLAIPASLFCAGLEVHVRIIVAQQTREQS